jgi:DNA polymerase-3 subunit alpha
VEGQLGFFDLPNAAAATPYDMKQEQEFDQNDLLAYEKEALGFYLTGHPLKKFQPLANALRTVLIASLLNTEDETETGNWHDEDRVNVLAIVVSVKKKVVKNNQTMAFAALEDQSGQMEALVFPSVLETCGLLLMEGRVLLASCRLSLQEGKEAKLLVNQLQDAETMEVPTSKNTKNAAMPQHSFQKNNANSAIPQKVFLRVPSADHAKAKKAALYLDVFDGGSTKVAFFDANTQSYRAWTQPVDWNPTLDRMLETLLGAENLGRKSK